MLRHKGPRAGYGANLGISPISEYSLKVKEKQCIKCSRSVINPIVTVEGSGLFFRVFMVVVSVCSIQ